MTTAPARVTIVGVSVDAVTVTGAIDAFRRFIRDRRTALVCSANVDVCMRIRRDPELRDIYRGADLVLVDGTPMMWAARFLGTPLPERVSGSDFLPAFCGVAAREEYTVFLLGAAPGIAAGAAQELLARSPGLRIAGTYAPPLGFERDDQENARIIDIVRAARPDVMFVAFGSPKQEKWLARFRHATGVPVAMGVGSSFDYLAGRLRRAPEWMQRTGMEWTYRLVQEPGRLWRRYLMDDPPFVYYLVSQRLSSRAASRREVEW